MAEDTDKNKKNNELDEDILQSKKDVLRAKDIIPSDTDSGSAQQENRTHEEKSKEQKESEAPDITPAESDKKTQIPEFDLADQIMARQRKTTAVRRKAPSQKQKVEETTRKTEPKHRIISRKPQMPENKLIAEIIARDIQKLCQSN